MNKACSPLAPCLSCTLHARLRDALTQQAQASGLFGQSSTLGTYIQCTLLIISHSPLLFIGPFLPSSIPIPPFVLSLGTVPNLPQEEVGWIAGRSSIYVLVFVSCMVEFLRTAPNSGEFPDFRTFPPGCQNRYQIRGSEQRLG